MKLVRRRDLPIDTRGKRGKIDAEIYDSNLDEIELAITELETLRARVASLEAGGGAGLAALFTEDGLPLLTEDGALINA